MIDATQPIANAVRKHFVSLSCVQSKPNSTGRKLHLFSGFVIEILDAWFFITAGHVVRDLRTETAAGSTFGKWRLADTISGPKFQNTAVPFEFSLDSWLVVENESIGIDYAAIHLEDFFARQLSVGGVTPIARDAWADHPAFRNRWACPRGRPRSDNARGDSRARAA